MHLNPFRLTPKHEFDRSGLSPNPGPEQLTVGDVGRPFAQVDTEVSANMDEDDLELALRLSMEALPQVVCNRWSRRKAAAKIRARWEPGGRG